MIKKISYERRVYESVDDNSLSKAISQKTDEKNKSCNKGIVENYAEINAFTTLTFHIYATQHSTPTTRETC